MTARPPLRRDPIFSGLAVLTLLVHVRLLFSQGLDYSTLWAYLDEGYRLYPSLRLLQGERLYRDMFTVYPPLSYYLHALAFVVLGVKISSVRVVLIASQLATTLLTYAVARRLMSRGFAAYAALLTIAYGIARLNMGYSGWYVMPMALGGVLFVLRWIDGDCRTRGPLVGAGVCAALAIATKLRDGVWVAIGCGVAVIAVRILREEALGRRGTRPVDWLQAAHLLLAILVVGTVGSHLDPARFLLFVLPSFALCLTLLTRQLCFAENVEATPGALGRDLLVFGGTILAVSVPWIVGFVWNVGAAEFWEQTVAVPAGMMPNMLFWNTAWGYPPGAAALGCAAAALAALLLALFGPTRWRRPCTVLLAGAFVVVPTIAWTRSPSARTLFWHGGLFALLPLASCLALFHAMAHWRRPDARVQAVFAVAALNGTMTMTLYPWTDENHWLWAGVPALVVATFAASRLHAALARHTVPLRWLAVAGMGVALAGAAQPVVAELWGAQPVAMLAGSPTADLPLRQVERTQAVVDLVNANVPPGAAMLEIPGSLHSFITGRRQAARLDYFYFLNGALWDEERELEAIRRTNPPFALVRDLPGWRESFPKIARFVKENYRPYRQAGKFELLRRRRKLAGAASLSTG